MASSLNILVKNSIVSCLLNYSFLESMTEVVRFGETQYYNILL